MLGIIVRTQFEGVHCYPEAPEGVEFLRVPHRHIFHVEAEIETFHDDRELEFILVKREIDKFLAISDNIGRTSCEQIAKRVSAFIKASYPLPGKTQEDEDGCTRKVNVKVFEDNENGAFVREF
jgi:hypothetical protein